MNISLANASKKEKYEFFQRSLESSGITGQPNLLPCPLCWQEKSQEELTLEHMVPRSLGGTQTTLTCKDCNNTHGSTRDAHLVRYLRSLEAFEGHGMLDTELNINGHKLRAAFDYQDRNFHIIPKATNPAAQMASRADLQANRVPQIDFTISFGFSENNFNTAVLRSAYLVLFKCFGYEYVKHDIVQVVRRRIMDESLESPKLNTLILGINFVPPWDAQHYIFESRINDVPCFVVIIRIRNRMTKYLAACLPIPGDRCHEFFELMQAHRENQSAGKFEMSISPNHIFS